MFGPAHLAYGHKDCLDTICHDQSIHYAAHMEELESAVKALLNGEDFEFSFDLTEYDKYYLNDRITSILGPDAVLDFE